MNFKFYLPIVAALFLADSFSAFAVPGTQPTPASQLPEIRISTPDNRFDQGEEIILDVEITNSSGNEMVLVMPLDGSESRFRFPHAFLSVVPLEGQAPKRFPACKTVNPLEPGEFFSMKPGETRKLYPAGLKLDRFFLWTPGRFKLKLEYATDAKKEVEWYGPYTEEYWNSRGENDFWAKREPDIIENRKLLARIAKIRVVSNELEIIIGGDKAATGTMNPAGVQAGSTTDTSTPITAPATPAGIPAGAGFFRPAIELPQAMEIVRKLLEAEKPDLSSQYLRSATLQYDSGRKVFYWHFQWAWSVPRMGMEFAVEVSMDGVAKSSRTGP